MKEILKFRFMKFRFGRISREYYEKFSSYVYETIDTVMFKCEEEGDYVWVVYFVPESLADKIDAIYASMHLSGVSFRMSTRALLWRQDMYWTTG